MRARDWWLANRDRAPIAFDEEIGNLIDLLTDVPHLVGLPVRQRPGARRLCLRRIRYFVYFESADADTVVILALWHGSREGSPSGA